MENQGTQRCRVVLVPPPFQGHITPMLQLGAILHSKGFSITVAHAEFNAPDSSKHPEFLFLPLPDNVSDSNSSFWNLLEVITTINVNCREPLQRYLVQKIEKQEPHDQVCCIIYDSIMYFTDAVANHMKLPSIILRTTSAFNFVAWHATPRLLAEGYIPLPESLSNELVPGLHPLRSKDLPFTGTEELEFLEDLRNIRSSAAVVWNTVDFLEHSSLLQLQQQYQIPIFSIGPLHKIAPASTTSLLEEDTSCVAWLDKQAPNSVIYVSMGSLAMVDKKELTETAWGLANSDQPFLWVMRAGLVDGSDQCVDFLPKDFKERIGERGHMVKWAPQKEVLAHRAVGGFWSHCGWNSTLESIEKGSFLPESSKKSPKEADKLKLIDIEGQGETGIWVPHPGSEVAPARGTRKGKSRLLDTHIPGEASDSIATSLGGSQVNDSSSTDESLEYNKEPQTNPVRRGLRKMISVFHRSPRQHDKSSSIEVSIPSPHSNLRNLKEVNAKEIGVKFIMENNSSDEESLSSSDHTVRVEPISADFDPISGVGNRSCKSKELTVDTTPSEPAMNSADQTKNDNIETLPRIDHHPSDGSGR